MVNLSFSGLTSDFHRFESKFKNSVIIKSVVIKEGRAIFTATVRNADLEAVRNFAQQKNLKEVT